MKTNLLSKIMLILAFHSGFLVVPQLGVAQHRKIPTEPFQITDASNGNQISEALVIPRHFSGKGALLLPPEGTGKLSRLVSLKRPFIYKSGTPFIVKKPKAFIGLPLIFAYVGKFKDIDGVLVIAPGFKPLWTVDLWSDSTFDPNYKRQFKLKPISKDEWNLLLENELKPLIENNSRIEKNCEIWGLEEKCSVKIDFKKNEREIVRSFLKKTLS